MKLRSSAALVAIGILMSRISGLIRDRVFAHYLGNSDAAGAFKAALRIPNFLQNLLGEGVLSASFIPVYARLLAQGERELANRVAGILVSILALTVSLIVALGVITTPVFVDLVAPGFHGEVRELTIRIVQILFPGVGLLVLSAWCLGILNSHRKFFLSYAAPVLWNAGMIAALVLKGRHSTHSELAVWLAWGSVAGSAMQLAVQVPFVIRYGGAIRAGLQLSLAPVRQIFRSLGPIVVSRGVVQLSAYIDGMIASFLGAGAVASLAYAQTIYLLPIGLFGMSVAAAELPEMSSQFHEDEAAFSALRQRIVSARRNIAFFVVPSAAGFVLLGRHIVSALYQTGQFGPDDTLYVWYVLIGSVVGLLAATWGRLYSSAFYALRDTRTPLNFAVVRVALTALLGYVFAFPMRSLWATLLSGVLGMRIPALPAIEVGLGAIGLTASAGFAGWVEFLLLQRALSRRIGGTRVPVAFQLRTWAAALVAVACALALDRWGLARMAGPRGMRVVGYDIRPLLVIGAYALSYLAAAWAVGIDEVRRVLRLFRKS